MAELTIENYTDWSTSDIRMAVRAAEKHFDLKWSRKVIVKYCRRHGMRGRAAYPADRRQAGKLKPGYGGCAEGQLVKLYLPTKVPEDMAQLERNFLWLVLHEVGHNAGLSHRDMGVTSPLNVVWGQPEKPHAMAGLSFTWEGSAAAYVNKSKALIARSNVILARGDAAVKALTRAQERVADLEKKLKRAQAQVKKASAKVKYYEKKKTAPPEEKLAEVVQLPTKPEPTAAPQLIAAKE